jgi:hypothetical protein
MASNVHERLCWQSGQVVGAGAPGLGGTTMERMRVGRVRKRMLVSFIVRFSVVYWVGAVGDW